MKPSFLIIGGVKCASSSLYRYLNEHPQVLPCKTKEPGYLNNKNPLKLLKGYKSYINLFPRLNENEVVADWLEIGKDLKMVPSTFSKQIEKGQKYITGEATATTFVNAKPWLIKLIFPQIKTILSLRNPTDRFISHFNMFKRFEKEGKKGHKYGQLEDFISKEIAAYNKGEKTKIIHQGVYVYYLSNWKKTFGHNLIIVQSDHLQGDKASQTLDGITSFLGLDSFDFSGVLGEKHNVGPSISVPTVAQELLDSFYLSFNQELFTQYQIAI
jgi:hypothetical protein